MNVLPPGQPQEPYKPQAQAPFPKTPSLLENVGQPPHVRCTIDRSKVSPDTLTILTIQRLVTDVIKAKPETADLVSVIHYVHTHEVADWFDGFCQELYKQDEEVQKRVWEALAYMIGASCEAVKSAQNLPPGYKIAEFLWKEALLREKS